MFALPDPPGPLSERAVYVYYDGPHLFSCESKKGDLFLGIWTRDDDKANTWLLAPVSPSRLLQVEGGGITIRNAVLGAEHAWRIVFDKEAGNWQCSMIPVSMITEDEIPGDITC